MSGNAYQGRRTGGYNQNGRNRYSQNDRREPPARIEALPIPEDYLDRAEELMREHTRDITTSKLRRIYSLVTAIYDEERLRTETTLSKESLSAIGMIRVRMAYEAGRDAKVKTFLKTAKLMEYIKGIGEDREAFLRLTQYMEALVAYHRFFGEGEN